MDIARQKQDLQDSIDSRLYIPDDSLTPYQRLYEINRHCRAIVHTANNDGDVPDLVKSFAKGIIHSSTEMLKLWEHNG